ncbi:outer membrane beta-barrel protein [Marinobacter mobilis]|uniref:Opacity protein n=1 Tax=Marinobacter mobilis TaxID=488533 RepID=A0A1H2VFS4_9GAMM|nr:outer membrane beta-barrel protein [Marinobacter mobilis]SDW66784.1 Opacity protein [Marinobacter mobilis]
MKKSLIAGICLGATAAAVATAPATAAGLYKSGDVGVYGGINYTFITIDSGNEDADVGVLGGKVGVLATPFFGVEARGGFGVDDDRAGGADVSLDNYFGGYATLNLANESPATPYAIFGFTRVEVEREGFFTRVTEDESDFSYGLGVNVEMAPQVSGNIEYMRYFDKNDTTVDGLGLGVTVHF